jgi:hypothetical protein
MVVEMIEVVVVAAMAKVEAVAVVIKVGFY